MIRLLSFISSPNSENRVLSCELNFLDVGSVWAGCPGVKTVRSYRLPIEGASSEARYSQVYVENRCVRDLLPKFTQMRFLRKPGKAWHWKPLYCQPFFFDRA